MPSEEQVRSFKEEAQQREKQRQESYKRDGMSIRTYVLHVALHMEERISKILGHLLGIDTDKSKVIGYRSNPISFNQKVQLLIEIGTIEGDRFKDFQLMMEVRNMLMHQLDARSMVQCFHMIKEKDGNDSKKNKVIALAEEKIKSSPLAVTVDWNEEDKLNLGVRLLFDRVSIHTTEAITKMVQSQVNRSEGTAALEHTNNMSNSIGDPIRALINTVESSEQESYTKEQVIGVLKLAGYSVVKDYFASLEKERKKSNNELMQKMGLEDPSSASPTDPTDPQPS